MHKANVPGNATAKHAQHASVASSCVLRLSLVDNTAPGPFQHLPILQVGTIQYARREMAPSASKALPGVRAHKELN